MNILMSNSKEEYASLFRKSKRNKSLASFNRKNLTLSIDIIEEEARMR